MHLIDVRTEEEFAAVRLPGARHVSLQQLHAGDIGFLTGVALDTPLYVYCMSGGRSAAAAMVLRSKGFCVVEDLGSMVAAAAFLEERASTVA